MEVNKIDPAALLGATLAGVLGVMMAEGPFNLFEVPIGLTLFAILITFDAPLKRSFGASVVFASSCGLAAYITFGYWLEVAHAPGAYAPNNTFSYIPHDRALVYWFIFAAASCVVDQLRISILRRVEEVAVTPSSSLPPVNTSAEAGERSVEIPQPSAETLRAPVLSTAPTSAGGNRTGGRTVMAADRVVIAVGLGISLGAALKSLVCRK